VWTRSQNKKKDVFRYKKISPKSPNMFAVSLAMRGATAMVTPRAARLESGRGSALKLPRVATMRAMKKKGSDGLFVSSTSGTRGGEERLIDRRKRVSTFGNAMERREERIERKDVAVNDETMKLEIDGGDVVSAVEIKKKRLGKRPKQVEYSDEMCVFAADGTCPHIKTCKRRHEPLRYRKDYVTYVPASHDTYPGKRCCKACYNKILASGRICCFAADGECTQAKKAKANNERLVYTFMKKVQASLSAKHVGKYCCTSCYVRLRKNGPSRSKIDLSKQKPVGRICSFYEDGTCVKANNCLIRNVPIKYSNSTHIVPPNHPRAGEYCCYSCFKKIQAQGHMCVRAKEGTCFFFNACRRKKIDPVVYSALRKLPDNHEEHPGEWICPACLSRMLSAKRTCAFVKDGTCIYFDHIREGEAQSISHRVPKWHPYAGENTYCCETCFLKLTRTCAFEKDEKKCIWSRRMSPSGIPKKYLDKASIRVVPETSSKYAGQPCCADCYRRCIQETYNHEK
jgi:hypothetical protein